MIEWMVLSPHPPLLVPEIGKEMISKVQTTKDGLKKVFEDVTNSIDTLFVVTPHGFASRKKITFYNFDEVTGNLIDFGGARNLCFSLDRKSILDIKNILVSNNIKTTAVSDCDIIEKSETLDHGSYVPLYYAMENLEYKPELIIMNPAFADCDQIWKSGKLIADYLEKLNKRVGVIISGDLSHRLTKSAPGGYYQQAFKFDNEIQRILQEDTFNDLKHIPFELREKAGECGYRPLLLGAGMLTDYDSSKKVMSYEAPFGVGYLVARLL
ncbi:class III extradiol dioxygenase subunit B-like domain-containing protein [Natranaerobius trueperi]|uniref:Extradiol ring-cleavage dioxygenase class III enzyme subunit B domain-containing protein n=1 Tax=Natranaerobius trueperi TaxID=759412 RepID=A0A226BZU4_9FIRM|nr:class III extradiol dioxygenase subunit B-like domain-containing protein [Natranaerobius trueperi]OWZ84451.1 hypothetical protein CDO51_02800 [Natranaerobius trueperi]